MRPRELPGLRATTGLATHTTPGDRKRDRKREGPGTRRGTEREGRRDGRDPFRFGAASRPVLKVLAERGDSTIVFADGTRLRSGGAGEADGGAGGGIAGREFETPRGDT